MPYTDEYQFFIDWDNDGGLRVNDFQHSFTGWEAKGTTPPVLALSSDQAFSGTRSLKITWKEFNPFIFGDADAGFDDGTFGVDGLEATDVPFTFGDAGAGFDTGEFDADVTPIVVVSSYVQFTLTKLKPNKHYTLSLWVRPTQNHVHFEVGKITSSAATDTLDEWQELTVTFVSTAEQLDITIHPEDEPITRDLVYVDYVSIRGQFEQVVPQNEFSFSYGRDDSRALSPVEPAETELEFLDLNGRYSPLNTNSELYPNIDAGREVNIRAVYNGAYYDLLWGLLDEVDLDPSTEERSATFSVVDIMAFVGQTKLDTKVYEGKRTGELIHIILDEIGWPEHRRDIDAGATWVGRWWAFDVDASTAISELVASEGPPAYAFLGPSGDFIFRDRHHRLISSRSIDLQATWSANADEPAFSNPMDINLGWKDVINSVKLNVTPRLPAQYYNERVWTSEGIRTIAVGQTLEVKVVTDDPFVHARVPVDDTNPFENRHGIELGDYTLLTGSVNVTLSRTSGQSTTIYIQNTGGTTAAIQNLSLYAIPLEDHDDEQVVKRDESSISNLKRESSQDLEAPWANANDTEAIAEIVLGQRANKLPTVAVTLNNGTSERLNEIYSRQLGDRVHIKEPRSFVDHDFFIEGFEHTINAAGKYHEVTFSCEQIPVYEENVEPFRFGTAGSGFDEGVFGYDGLSESSSIFVLDESDLDEGLLAL